MASVKVKFRPSSVDGQEGAVYYQIIHERRVRQLLSEFRVLPEEWCAERSTVTAAVSGRREYVAAVREGVRRDLERLARIERRLDDMVAGYSADDIVGEFRRYVEEYTMSSLMRVLIARFLESGQVRTSETYRAALNSFMRFRDGREVVVDCLTPDVMEGYEGWLRMRGVVPNTSSFYARVLRAVYNRAVERGLTEDRHPFRHVYTGVEKTVKRALPLEVVSRIRRLDLSGWPELDFARDMFIFSFCLRGMSFIDMAFLRKSDLRDGHVVYRRRKTGQMLSIAWTREMQMILDKYPANESGYLLPIIPRPVANERNRYRNVAYNINRSLKRIAVMVGISMPLTLYVARHSWASAARSKGVPLSVISEGMGHDSEMTTRIYLASLDTSVVDNANALILGEL